MAIQVSISTASSFVTIDTFTPYTMTCYSFYDFAAQASAIVDTDVQVDAYWYGDLGGVVLMSVTILSGTACNIDSFATSGFINCSGENISNLYVNLSPSSYGTQIYQVGTNTAGGFYPC